jgi:RNA polymerase sigma factor (sigma-70 family)
MMADEAQLLAVYAENRGSDAFARLVERHIGFVYQAALRQVGDPHLAEDVTQAVFLLLSQRAGELKEGTVIKGWLFNTTRYVVANARRAEARRKVHEREAAGMNREAVVNDQWPAVAPHLDDALSELAEKDRQVLLLRFFDDLPLAALGRTLGISEQAAQKRVERALERLRHLLVGRGAALGSAAMGEILKDGAGQAAPVHLLKATIDVTMSGVTGAAQPSVVFSLAKGASFLMARTKLKFIVASLIVCLWAVSTTAIAIFYGSSPMAQSPAPERPASSPAGAAPGTMDINSIYSIYTLQAGEVFQRIVDAPPELRKRFVELHFPGNRRSSPEDHFIIGRSGNRFAAGGDFPDASYSLRSLINMVGFARNMSGAEIQLDDALGNQQISGDIIFKQDASEKELCDGLVQFLRNEYGINAGAEYRDVPMNVILLSGQWQFKQIPTPGPDGRDMDPQARRGTPVIEIYGTENWDPKAQMTGSSSTEQNHLERNLSDALGEKVFTDAQGIPPYLCFTSFGKVQADPAKRDIALNHIQEQTGLTWTRVNRDVHTLIVGAKKAGGV